MGLNSFGLTLINIVVIIIVGIVILKIKEVAPHTTRKSLNRFWKEDLKITREYNSKGRNGASVLMQDLDEAGNKKEEILTNLEADQTFTAVNRRAAYAAGPSIITDVRHRNNLGSNENIHQIGRKNDGGEGVNKKGGWMSGFFGGGNKSAAQEQGPSERSVEEGQQGREGSVGTVGRHRPKLH